MHDTRPETLARKHVAKAFSVFKDTPHYDYLIIEFTKAYRHERGACLRAATRTLSFDAASAIRRRDHVRHL